MEVYLTRDLPGADSCAFPIMSVRALPRFPKRGHMPAQATSLLPAAELCVLREHRSNVMLVGSVASTESVLLALQPAFAAPVTSWQPGSRLALPSAGGTLVLRNVPDLTPTEQSALFDWLDRDRRRTQVISTSTRPLMPLLEQGVFSDALYYRLNTVYLELPAE
jgi:Sigma-54 interaction domain